MTTDETAKKYILEILAEHVGAENKLERVYLFHYLNGMCSQNDDIEGISDRRMRNLIEELRKTDAGKWIVASQKDGGGYFTASCKAEAEEYIFPDVRRATTIYKARSKQLRMIESEISPQMRLEI